MSVRFLIQNVGRILAPLFLSGCYVSQLPLIPAGSGQLPVDGVLRLCPEEAGECFEFRQQSDAYFSLPEVPPEDRARIRFAVLNEHKGQPVYIMEVGDETSDEGFTYLIARRRSVETEAYGMLDAVLPSCSDLSGDNLSVFEAGGGQITGQYSKSCRPPDLETLRSTWIALYADKLSDEAWWAEARNDGG